MPLSQQNSSVSSPLSMCLQPVLKYLPTYRLDPKYPLNKEVCEKIMRAVMDNAFENFMYSPKTSLTLCAQISEEIKNRIKAQHFDRYVLENWKKYIKSD